MHISVAKRCIAHSLSCFGCRAKGKVLTLFCQKMFGSEEKACRNVPSPGWRFLAEGVASGLSYEKVTPRFPGRLLGEQCSN